MDHILEKMTQVNDKFTQIQALTFTAGTSAEIRKLAKDSLGDMFELMNMIINHNKDKEQ